MTLLLYLLFNIKNDNHILILKWNTFSKFQFGTSWPIRLGKTFQVMGKKLAIYEVTICKICEKPFWSQWLWFGKENQPQLGSSTDRKFSLKISSIDYDSFALMKYVWFETTTAEILYILNGIGALKILKKLQGKHLWLSATLAKLLA